MSSFIIKLIAIISMTIDHANYIFERKVSLNVIGRIAFPLYCFQVVVGYAKTKSLWKYIARMLFFALVSQIPYMLFMNVIGGTFALNVLFTLALGLISMYIYDLKIEKNSGKLALTDGKGKILIEKIDVQYGEIPKTLMTFIKLISIAFIAILSFILKTEYEIWGILLILFIHVFYPFKDEINLLGHKIKIKRIINNIVFIVGILTFAIVQYTEYWAAIPILRTIAFTVFTFIPAIIMLLNNEKKGPNLKYFFYIYYPAQFIVLTLMNSMITS